MANPFMSCRVPQELYNRCETIAKTNRMAMSDLMRKAIECYVNSGDLPEPTPPVESSELEDFRERLATTEAMIQQLRDELSERVAELEKKPLSLPITS